MRIVFDIETDSLLPKVSKMYCIAVKQDSEETQVFYGDKIKQLFPVLEEADELIGHNIIGFDLPVLKKLYGFRPKLGCKIVDTLLLSRLSIPDIYTWDKLQEQAKGTLTYKVGSYSLKAWGYRLGILKGTFGEEEGFDVFKPEMLDYCKQDVEVTKALYDRLMSKPIPSLQFWIETEFAKIIQRQEANGIGFNIKDAESLVAMLLERDSELDKELIDIFGDITKRLPDFIPKKDNVKKGYIKGVPVERYKTVPFNPNSGKHIVYKLKEKYDWVPTEFTDKDNPKVDEETLSKLDYPEIPLILKSMTVKKRLSQIFSGGEAWLKHLDKEGRIHGRVHTCGTSTGRCSHSNPNLAQVPNGESEYGKECRRLFISRLGYKMVGVDSAACQLRILAHYLSFYDSGRYSSLVSNPDTDIHTVNQIAAGLQHRKEAKTLIYCILFGGQAKKVGIVLNRPRDGKKILEQFKRETIGLKKLMDTVEAKVEQQGFVLGIDGRRYNLDQPRLGIAMLVQGGEAIFMKTVLIIADWLLQAEGYVPIQEGGVDYEWVLNVHDEVQVECKEDIADNVASLVASAFEAAGKYLNIKCPMRGDPKIGNNWEETH